LLRHILEQAERTLDVAVYEVGPFHAALLARASQRGVRVRMLLDAHAGPNLTATHIAQPAGVECRVLGGHPGAEAHWKLLVADDSVAAGTGNLLRRDAPDPGQPGTREWWALIRDATAVRTAACDAFEKAWAESSAPPLAWRRAVAPPAPHVPPVGVPPHHTEPLTLDVAAERLQLRAATGAEVHALLAGRLAAVAHRALITVPYVHTHVPAVRVLLDALVAARGRGADVRLLLGAVPDPVDAAALTPLIEARVMDPLRCTTGHAKGVVADAAALVCSANWSGAGLGANRESAQLLDDPRAADWFAAALDRDWALADPLPGTPHPPKG
jgi:phosphatidylserine/phosphatidylglycerophosphate/cardiolipin synthase-like enzyme